MSTILVSLTAFSQYFLPPPFISFRKKVDKGNYDHRVMMFAENHKVSDENFDSYFERGATLSSSFGDKPEPD